jgi:hypothetical protein
MDNFSLALSVVGAGRITNTTVGFEECAKGEASCEATFKLGNGHYVVSSCDQGEHIFTLEWRLLGNIGRWHRQNERSTKCFCELSVHSKLRV